MIGVEDNPGTRQAERSEVPGHVIDWQDGSGGFIEVDGKSLEYRCHGASPRVAPTLVLLHEGLGSVAQWRDFPMQLANATGLGVFVWSRAGYGNSDPVTLPRPLDYMNREALDVLPQVLSALAAPKVILLGHSDGASIAAIYAGSIADYRVRGLVLMAPHFFTEPDGLAAIREARRHYAQADGEFRERLANYHRHVDTAFAGWCDAWLDPGFVDWDITECIDYLRVPTLVIQGDNDQYGSTRQIDVVVERSYAPVDVVVLPDCRHSPHRDQADATVRAVQDFADRLVRIDAPSAG